MPGGTSSGFSTLLGALAGAIAIAIGVSPEQLWQAAVGAFCGAVIFIGSAREYTLIQRRWYASVSFLLGLLAGPSVPRLVMWVARLDSPPPLPIGVCAAVVSVICVGVLVWLQSQSKNPLQLFRLIKPTLRNLLAALTKEDDRK